MRGWRASYARGRTAAAGPLRSRAVSARAAGARRLRLAAAGRLTAALDALQLLAVELIGHVVAGGRLVLRPGAALAPILAGRGAPIPGHGRPPLLAVGAARAGAPSAR